MAKETGRVRIAAMGDIHCTNASRGAFQSLFAQVNESADVLLIVGDLTDYGLPEEANVLARELAVLHVPVLAVLGNHDHESDKQEEVVSILTEAGVTILDGDAHEVQGVGFAAQRGSGVGLARAHLRHGERLL